MSKLSPVSVEFPAGIAIVDRKINIKIEQDLTMEWNEKEESIYIRIRTHTHTYTHTQLDVIS